MAELTYFDEKSPTYLANKRFFADFLDQDDDESMYMAKVREMLEKKQNRLVVSINDLRRFDEEVAKRFLQKPMEYFAPWQAALKDYVKAIDQGGDDLGKGTLNRTDEYFIGIEGSFGSHRLGPRELKAEHLSMLVCVEGIATKCSMVRPKVKHTVHYCEVTGAHTESSYHDATSITGFPTGSVYPVKDDEGNPLTTEFGLSTYDDHQTMAIQEMPERAPAGLLPRSVDVVLSGDLVDRCKPGDRVQVIGIFRAIPSASSGETSGLFKSILIGNHVRPLTKEVANSKLSEQDIANIREIGRRKDVFELMSKSIAPSIYGHDTIKKALILLLLGGCEKNLANGTHIRGDINMMMIGDPSTAKSQLLRFVLNIAPLAINTTGRGSSGVGLTAAVTQDKETGERRLEAGAMVLADRGVVCIDEFDKMSDADRVAIHEVMEQQTVTIAKAGIHMSLNARCSVVAAANPVYGQYDTNLPPHQNINLPDSLLSRFDLLFIVLDQPDVNIDREISRKVINNHRYVRKGSDFMDEFADEDDPDKDGDEDANVFLKFDKHLHDGDRDAELLKMNFIKKYLQFAKQSYTPKLTVEASKIIGAAYTELRNNEDTGRTDSMPITARALETLIRLSSAHAKCRLSKEVTKDDVKEALTIMKFAIENDTQVKDDDDDEQTRNSADLSGDESPDEMELSSSDDEEAKNRSDNDDDDDDDMDDSDDMKGFDSDFDLDDSMMNGNDSDDGSRPFSQKKSKKSKSKKTRRKRKRSRSSDDDLDEEELTRKAARSSSSSSPRSSKSKKKQRKSHNMTPEQRKDAFLKAVGKYMRSKRISECSFDELLGGINKGDEMFDEKEADTLLQELESANKVMYRDGFVHRI